MKNFIVNGYQTILYIGMFFWIIGWTFSGYTWGEVAGGIVGLLFGLFTSVLFLGFIFIVLQIRDLLQDLVNIHKGTTQQ